MTRPPKLPKKREKTKNVTLKGMSWFFKQLTMASVAASFYAMTFVAFVGLCAPLALCCDPIYWGEVPFRTKPVLTHMTNVPQEEYIPITYATKSSRVADLRAFKKCGYHLLCYYKSNLPHIAVVPLLH